MRTEYYFEQVNFEWDPQKNASNIQKHGVSFEEATSVFDDPLHLSRLDQRFSYFEERWITVGKSGTENLLVVAHIFFDLEGDEVIRIISARRANPHEQGQYEEL